MTTKWEPEWAVPPSETLREFIMRWCTDPAEALFCATNGVLTKERATELINGTGKPWTLAEASTVGYVMGPHVGFWQNLLNNYREHTRRQGL